MPLWEDARIIKKPSNIQGRNEDYSWADEIVYIPFSPTNYDYIGAILMVGIGGQDTTFKMLYNWEYRKYPFIEHSDTSWVARDIFNLFVNFEYAVYGHTQFQITDPQIFGITPHPDSVVWATLQPSSNRDIIDMEFCQDILVCKIIKSDEPVVEHPILVARSPLDPMKVECHTKNVCTKYSYFVGSGGDGGGTSGPGSNGGQDGGGGLEGASGYGWYSDPCPEPAGTTITPTTTVCGAPAGWIALEALFSIKSWNTSEIPDDPNSNFDDCVRALLSNKLTQNRMQELLNANLSALASNFASTFPSDFNVKFKFDNNVPMFGESTTSVIGLLGGQKKTINVTIKLNPTQLANASEELVAGVIMHEFMHSLLQAYKNEDDNHNKMFLNKRIIWNSTVLKQFVMPNGTTNSNVGLADFDAIAFGGVLDQWANNINTNTMTWTIDAPSIPYVQNLYSVDLNDMNTYFKQHINSTRGTKLCP